MAEQDEPEVWIDRGGTFIDCISRHPDGTTRVAKILSSLGELAAIRAVLGVEDTPNCSVRMGTTLATNALLERKGVDVAVLTHRGFADLLRIDDQTRPDLFALDRSRPEALTEVVVEIPGRMAADGGEVEPLDRDGTIATLESLRASGVQAVVVALLHSHRFPAHERAVAAWARELGFECVVASHEASTDEGLLGRTQTALVDAYLQPGLQHALGELKSGIRGRFQLIQSSGDLVDAASFRAKDAILSGPAGGVVACATIAAALELDEVLGFDMGGTSTDVCRFGGDFERRFEADVAGVRIRAPMLSVHTVASGGGSICRYDGHRMQVGPRSVGADPGPLCYGQEDGTDVALTDAALVLGRIIPERFPFPLSSDRARDGLGVIGEKLGRDIETTAAGFFEIAVDQMASAITDITVARGHDARSHTLIVYGGAGGQYACAVAERLGIRRWVSHPWAGVLSAFGIGSAPEGRQLQVALSAPLDNAGLDAARAALATLPTVLTGAIRSVHLRARHRGTRAEIEIQLDDVDACRAEFEHLHRQRFGYHRPNAEIELVQLRVHDRIDPSAPRPAPPIQGTKTAEDHRLFWNGQWVPARVWNRDDVPIGRSIDGPAVIVDSIGTHVIDPGWSVVRDETNVLHVQRESNATTAPVLGDRPDPVLLEVLGNQFMSIGQRMGTVLRRTAMSTNVRDRRDFSCAIFDEEARLIANAPHIPVHLGAMGVSVQAIRDAHPQMRPGDVFVTNDPAAGGSHLPDLTVVAPVFEPPATGPATLRGFVAVRAHHSDVGGITPGSMPAFSSTLSEEGFVLRNLQLVREGVFDADGVLERISNGPHPARRPDENLADLRAQTAACVFGVARLEELAERFGWDTLSRYMGHLLDHGESRVREALATWPAGERTFEDSLDDGTPIRVRIQLGEQNVIDFTGTAPRHAGNLNAPMAVTRACVLYVLRTLVGEPIPLNDGCLRAIELIVPDGVLHPPPLAAVAGGNVETSQRIVDVLLGAFGRVAASQGTMNNVSLGDGRFGYYETLAGGAGAGRDFAGPSAQHTHMTNSHITDAEILETRVPVRVRRFAIRRGSGGDGAWRGGDGLVRELEALAPLTLSILSERRTRGPYGLHGGSAGSPGRNSLLRGDEVIDLGGKARAELRTGDVIRIETPGGGGFG